MLQQTQVKTVIPYWERWMRELPTIESLAKAKSEKIHKLWEGLGYYTRVRNMQKAAQQIIAQHDALFPPRRRRGNESQIKKKLESPHVVSYKFPENFDDVLALPGIGRYTAGAICSIAFNQPKPILDGNVMRVLTRVFGIATNPSEKKTNTRLWHLANELVLHASRLVASKRSEDGITHHASPCSHLNQSLMELGALICTPRNPQCEICPVKKVCVAFKENRVSELPNLDKRAASTARHFIAFVVEHRGRLLVRQRPTGVVNAHLWEFPNVEVGARLSEPQHTRLQNIVGRIPAINGVRTCSGSGDPRPEVIADAAKQILGFTPLKIEPLCTVKHSITRYRITLDAYLAERPGRRLARSGEWLTLLQLHKLAFTSAHQKILTRLKAGINQ